MDVFNGPMATESQFSDMRGKLDDVKDVMVKNIEMVLERGEKLELLVDKTDRLNATAFTFARSCVDSTADVLEEGAWHLTSYPWRAAIFILGRLPHRADFGLRRRKNDKLDGVCPRRHARRGSERSGRNRAPLHSSSASWLPGSPPPRFQAAESDAGNRARRRGRGSLPRRHHLSGLGLVAQTRDDA